MECSLQLVAAEGEGKKCIKPQFVLRSTGESASVHLCIISLKSLSLKENVDRTGGGEHLAHGKWSLIPVQNGMAAGHSAWLSKALAQSVGVSFWWSKLWVTQFLFQLVTILALSSCVPSPFPLLFFFFSLKEEGCSWKCLICSTRAGRARQRQEPPLPLLEAHWGLLILWDLLRLVWPSPLAMWVSLAWGCWEGASIPTPPWLDDSGAGYIPANSFFRQELEVPAGKTLPKNH